MQKKQSPYHFDQFYSKVWKSLETELLPASGEKREEYDSDGYNSDEDFREVPGDSARDGSGNRIEQQEYQKTRESMQFLTDRIQGNKTLPSLFPIPKLPKLDSSTSVEVKLNDIQTYLKSLSYNHFGSVFSIRKGASSKDLMKLAQEICRFGLPIKCLEAVVVATHLTNEIFEIDRYALSFKTKCNDQTYRHIVLVVKYKDKYGSLGLSRRHDLMDKPLQFSSIEELVQEFRESYERNMHKLMKVKLGGLVSHDHTSKVEGFPWPSKVLVGGSADCVVVESKTEIMLK